MHRNDGGQLDRRTGRPDIPSACGFSLGTPGENPAVEGISLQIVWAVVINASGPDVKVLGIVRTATGLVLSARLMIEAAGASRIGWSPRAVPTPVWGALLSNWFGKGSVGGWGGLPAESGA